MIRVLFCFTIVGLVSGYLSGEGAAAEVLPYYGDIVVTAEAVKVSDPTRTPMEVAAEVFINGTPVGKTPYEDGLPTGNYQIEVRYQNASAYAIRLSVSAGQRYTVRGKLDLPLTPAEREQQAREFKAEYRREQQAAFAQYQKEHDAWLLTYTPLKTKWKRHWILGGVLMGTGIAALIPGIVLSVSAKRDDEQAGRLYQSWMQSTDREAIDYLASEISELEDSRDAKNVSSIVLLSTGGAAFISGLVLAILAPELPAEPQTNVDLSKIQLSHLEIAPVFGRHMGGLQLSCRF